MILLRLYFLGSTHKAKHYSRKGIPYNGDENVYLRLWKNQKQEDSDIKVRFVFSGPNILDIGKLSINSICKKALKIISDYIESNIIKLGFSESDLQVDIAGHSRGGVIAQRVYEDLKTKHPKAKFNIAKYDEYAGPFNRLIRVNDSHDLGEKTDENEAPDYSLVVVSVKPGVPFKSISKNKNPKTIIFTTCSHGSCNAVGAAFSKLYTDSQRNGVFFHISDFHYKKTAKENFHEQIKELVQKNEYMKLTKSNALNLLKKLAKKIDCPPTVCNGNDIDKIINAILNKKYKIFYAISRRRRKPLINELIKLGILDVKKWQKYTYSQSQQSQFS